VSAFTRYGRSWHQSDLQLLVLNDRFQEGTIHILTLNDYYC
jgi:hypothetical protein